MDDDDGNSGDYEVGYGRPPRNSRWPKGQSGNPRGRPKGSRGLKTDLHAELVSRMEIQMNGKRVSGTKQQLMLKTLTARAATGDIRAIRQLITLVMDVFGPEDRGGDRRSLSENDAQILEQLLGDIAPDLSNEPPADEVEPEPAKENEDREDDHD